MVISKLSDKQLVQLFIFGQGDMTLVPGDPKRVTNKKLVRKCWSELLKRQFQLTQMKKGVK
tara:strand:- start:125 stop:307 length:183 start_codon:yes stop_codon:yes gene_type:complete